MPKCSGTFHVAHTPANCNASPDGSVDWIYMMNRCPHFSSGHSNAMLLKVAIANQQSFAI